MAVVAIPVMTAVGMAVDYTRANAARTAFQVALDATALTLSKGASNETGQALQTEATNTFNALFNRSQVSNVYVTPVYTTDNGQKLTSSTPEAAEQAEYWSVGLTVLPVVDAVLFDRRASSEDL